MAQPVAGTGKAGDSGSGQGEGQGQGSRPEHMEGSGFEEFLNTSRTGRRNAVPDIADEGGGDGGISTAELSADMAKLSCAEGGASPSSQGSQPSSDASKPPS